MKEKIYTIPLNEVFENECECPLCNLEYKLEKESIAFVLGASLMEPTSRIESNEKGFCAKHFEHLYNSKINTQGLGLILETHISEQNNKLKAIGNKTSNNKSKKKSNILEINDEFIVSLKKLSDKCVICDKLRHSMDRYIDIMFYMWFNDPEFKNKFNNNKGFCLKHFRVILKLSKKFLANKEKEEFLQILIPLQMKNMERIEEELKWFNKKADYRNSEAPWGNSKDSVSRSIQKLSGKCKLK